MTQTVHICSFEACPNVRPQTKYEAFRDAVLKAGRFSAFEATKGSLSAAMFDRLCRDPWIETDISCGFPWTRLTVRETAKPEFREILRCPVCNTETPTCNHRVRVFVRQEPTEPSERRPALPAKEPR